MNYIGTIINEKPGVYLATVYEYKWSFARGKTYDEAKTNLVKLIGKELLNEEKIIKPFSIDMIKALDVIRAFEKGSKDVIFMEIHIDETKLIKNFNKTVRTNVSVKIGLKELAKRNEINISKFLNDALSKELLE